MKYIFIFLLPLQIFAQGVDFHAGPTISGVKPGAALGTGIVELFPHWQKSRVFVGVGLDPKPYSVVFSVETCAEQIAICGADGTIGDSFRNDATKFYFVKTATGFDVRAIGVLPEATMYAIDIYVE